jgi:hypothetical protein
LRYASYYGNIDIDATIPMFSSNLGAVFGDNGEGIAA